MGVGVVMARVLTPEDFGAVAVALVVWEMIALLGGLGLTAKLIQQQEYIDEYANAAFWLNVLSAAAIAAVALSVAPVAAAFYNNPVGERIIQVLALGFFLSAIGTTHDTLLSKKMAFKTMSAVDVGLIVLRDIIAVAMVLSGCGLWSLVLPDLFVRPVRIAILWKLVPWRPQWRLGTEYWRDIFNYGKFVFGKTVLIYLNINGDFLVIGKVMGAASLGLYKFAYNLANWPVQNIVRVCSRVTFPAFAQIQTDVQAMQRLYLKFQESLSVVVFPCLFGLLAVSDLLIPLVYGEKWSPAILPLKIIIAFTTVRSLATIGGQILLALKLQSREFKMNAYQVLPLFVAILVGARFGIAGVAAGMSMVLSVFAIWFIAITNHAIELSIREIFKAVMPAFVSAICMWVGVEIILELASRSGMGRISSMAAGTAGGAVVYLIIMLFLFRETSRRFISSFTAILGPSLLAFRQAKT